MPQQDPIDETTPGREQDVDTDPRGDHFGERVVLNATTSTEVGFLQEYADALLEVLAAARDLGRTEVAELVEKALDRIGRDPHTVEIAEITDKILRGSHSSLTIQTHDGVILGYAEGGHVGGGR